MTIMKILNEGWRMKESMKKWYYEWMNILIYIILCNIIMYVFNENSMTMYVCINNSLCDMWWYDMTLLNEEVNENWRIWMKYYYITIWRKWKLYEGKWRMMCRD